MTGDLTFTWIYFYFPSKKKTSGTDYKIQVLMYIYCIIVTVNVPDNDISYHRYILI